MKTIVKTIEAKLGLISIEPESGRIVLHWRSIVKEDGNVIDDFGGKTVEYSNELPPGQLNQLRGLITALVAAFEAKYPV